MKRISPAALGWGAIAVVVVVYDGWALLRRKETLSAFFARSASTPTGRLVVHGAWLGLSWHLMHGGYTLLPHQMHVRYRKMHPLWALHDVMVARSSGQKVPLVPTSERL